MLGCYCYFSFVIESPPLKRHVGGFFRNFSAVSGAFSFMFDILDSHKGACPLCPSYHIGAGVGQRLGNVMVGSGQIFLWDSISGINPQSVEIFLTYNEVCPLLAKLN